MEKWKEINGFEDLYMVSNKGNVFSIKRRKTLKLQKKGKNYFCVRLHNKKNIKSLYVHRLVAEAFIPNPENKPQVNHKDGVKANNSIDNLEWVTNIENRNHAIKNMLVTNTRIVTIKKGDKKYTFNKIVDAQKHIGCSRRLIHDVLSKKYKTAYGWNVNYIGGVL